MPELHTLTARLNTLANPGRQGEDILQGLDVSNLPRNFVSRLINDSMGNSEYRRIASLGELETRPANSSHCGSCCASIFCCYTSMLIQHGTLGVMREDADFHFLAPGYHCYPVCGREMGEPLALTKPNTPLNFGTCGMMTVAEGCVGVLLVGPHYKLLAPGIYQWSSPQVRVEGVHRLNAERVALGPFTLVTVPEGCVAVTFNNGALRVLGLPTTTTALVHDDDSTTSASMLNRPAAAAGNLPSNRTYFLDDPKWNCEGMLPTVVQTDRLEGNDLLSKDNVELLMVAMSEWRIVDPERAVTNCSPTMEGIRTKVNHLVRATIARIVAGTNIGAGPVSGSVAAPMVVATAVTGDPIDHCDKRPAPSKEELSHLMQSEQATRHMAHLGLQMAAMGVEVLGVYVPEKRIKNDDIRSQIANQAVIGIHAEAERASADATAYATVKAAKAQAEAISLLAHAHADAGMRLGGPDGTAARLALSESMTKALENSKVTIFTGAPNMLPFMFGSDPSQSSQDQQVSLSATAGKRRPIAAAME